MMRAPARRDGARVCNGAGMPALDRDGVRIHYDVTGDGPPVLVTHGFSATSHMFAGTARALAPTHRVVTWDVRGHGRSDYPADDGAYTVPLSVGDMVGILDAVGADRAVLMGHSMGGYLSLETRLAHPERVAGLVLVGTGPGYRNDEARAGWNDMVEGFAVDLETKGLDGLPASEEVRADVHRSADGLVKAARGILRQYDGRVLESLPDISVPTLVVVGEHDLAFLKGSAYMASKIPGAEHVVLAGAGHSPMLSHPDDFHSVVAAFLARIDFGAVRS